MILLILYHILVLLFVLFRDFVYVFICLVKFLHLNGDLSEFQVSSLLVSSQFTIYVKT